MLELLLFWKLIYLFMLLTPRKQFIHSIYKKKIILNKNLDLKFETSTKKLY